ncbi:G-protein coupled receptor dmsr-1-like [Euwallacea fornicatus]|uniref:G-protein coupled receptor dmsr-1-like n=1 Tax=Euwallacea fornicatus TaxID=995702 RepID=UPI00338DD633
MDNNETAIRIYLKELFLSRGTNATDDYIEKIVVHTINRLEMASSTADPTCGGHLKELANIYAEDYHPYCAIVVCLLGIVTNCLNIIILTRKDMVSVPINRILTSLACADVLLMIEYIPFTLYYKYESKEKMFPYVGAVYMLCHMHVTQILHAISICLTLTLAVWRFLAIKYIEKNYVLCSHKRCTLAITTCYVLPLFLCVPQYIILTVQATNITEENVPYTLYVVDLTDLVGCDNKETLLKVNFWLYSIFLKLLPCLILIVISIWLINTLFKAKKGRQVLKSYDNNLLVSDGKDKKHSKYERRADKTTKMLIAILFLFLLTELPQGLFSLFIALNGKHLFLTCYQLYGEIMDICALLNGSINFILYCSMNRMFRITFGQVFRNKILGRWIQPTVSDTPTMIVANKTIITTV